jgi:hypothetical protein
MDDNYNNCQRFDIQVSTDPEEVSLIVLTESKEEETEEDLTPGFYLNGVLIDDDDELQD